MLAASLARARARGQAAEGRTGVADSSAFLRLRQALSPRGDSARAAVARAQQQQQQQQLLMEEEGLPSYLQEPAGDEGGIGGVGTPPSSERVEEHRRALLAARRKQEDQSRAAAAAAAPPASPVSGPSFGGSAAAAVAGDGPGAGPGGGSGAAVSASDAASLFGYRSLDDIASLAQAQYSLHKALTSFRPSDVAGKIEYKRTVSAMNKRFKEISRKLQEEAGTLRETEAAVPTLEIRGRVPVADIARVMGAPLSDVLDHLEAVGEDLEALEAAAREHGESAATVDPDVAEFVLGELGGRAVRSDFRDRVPAPRPSADEAEAAGLPPRVPVVTVMGHVDHGKTTLLDYLRRAAVAEGEAGGITQSISAFCVRVDDAGAGVDRGARAKKGGAKKAGGGGKNGGGKKGAASVVEAAMADATGCLTFLDTPGHQLFSGMRQRGTAVTDAVVLVVAAEDGVMPQTRECIELLARVPDVPVVVAATKVDRLSDGERANALEDLAKQLDAAGLRTDLTGGTVPLVPVSGVTGEGVEDLKEHLTLQCDVLELRADRSAPGEAAVLDSQLVRGQGYVADCVVQWGTLRVGDHVVVGHVAGRVKAMVDDAGARHREMTPGIPVRVTGMDQPPPAGELLMVVESAERAAAVADRRNRARELSTSLGRAREKAADAEAFAHQRRGEREREDRVRQLQRRQNQRRRLGAAKEVVPDHLQEQPWERALQAELVEEAEAEARGVSTKGAGSMVDKGQQRTVGEDPAGRRTLPVVLRADMKGSLEALSAALAAFPQDGVRLRVVREEVGSPSVADLEFARDTGAVLVAFNVGVSQEVQKRADVEGVDVVRGRVIYSVLQAVADAMVPLLPSRREEVVRGAAEVLSTFAVTTRRAAAERAAGCRVVDGVFRAASPVRVVRMGEVVFEAPGVASLKRFRDDVESVDKGQECGISLVGFGDYELGDRIQSLGMEDVRPNLDISYLGSGLGESTGARERA